MAQADAEITAPKPEGRQPWPLATVVWIDLAIIAILVFAGAFVVQSLVLGFGARAQGLSLADVRALGETELMRLVGIRGVFLSTLLQNVICIAVPIIRIRAVRRESLATIGFTARQLPLGIAVGLGVGLLALIANLSLSALFVQLFDIRQDQAAQFGALLRPGDVFGQLLFASIAVLLAPVGEETLFRGYLFNALRAGGGTTRLTLAYLVSAGLFAAIHLLNVTQGQLALVVPIFVVGLLFAAAMHLTGSIIPCIIAHAMNNSLSTLVLLFCINTSFPGCPV